MHNIYVKDIIEKCNGKLIIGNSEIILEDFCKDTRVLKENDIYVGIKGENFEGSNLYKEAFAKGAKGCIINNIELDLEYLNSLEDKFLVIVDDTIKCLQELATYKRSLYNIPVVGVTGSVGKTSTKDIIASVLSKKYKVCKTIGNYNNHIGVPLTILSLKDENCLVVEMGMNNLGEISLLSKIAKPTVAVITNVGTAHIGLLGSRENILKAKLEILDGMDEFGILVINNDNDLLHQYYLENKNSNIKTFGIINESDICATNIKLNELGSSYNYLDEIIKVSVPGEVFVLNSLCALLIGDLFNINIEDIKKGINNFELTKRRMQIEKINNMTIINDCYNANLDSMKSAVSYLGSLMNTRKIAILGDMLELGSYSENLHRELGKIVKENNIDILITVGRNSKYICEEAINCGFDKENAYNYMNNEEALSKIKEIIKENDSILIKSSLGMKFIEIYNGIKEI